MQRHGRHAVVGSERFWPEHNAHAVAHKAHVRIDAVGAVDTAERNAVLLAGAAEHAVLDRVFKAGDHVAALQVAERQPGEGCAGIVRRHEHALALLHKVADEQGRVALLSGGQAGPHQIQGIGANDSWI